MVTSALLFAGICFRAVGGPATLAYYINRVEDKSGEIVEFRGRLIDIMSDVEQDKAWRAAKMGMRARQAIYYNPECRGYPRPWLVVLVNYTGAHGYVADMSPQDIVSYPKYVFGSILWAEWCVTTAGCMLIAFLTLRIPEFLMRRIRSRNGRCVECGYNVQGTTTNICPECGMKVAT